MAVWLALPNMPRQVRVFAFAAGLAALAVAVPALATNVDGDALGRAARSVFTSPGRTALVLVAFGGAFAVRASVWRRLLPGLSFGHALAAIHLSLAGNHVLPLRMGEPLRVLSVVRRAGVPLEAAAASTVTLRAADLLALLALGYVASPSVVVDVAGPWTAPIVALLGAALAGGLLWLRAVARSCRGDVRLPDLAAFAGTVTAWLLESVLVWQSASWAGIDLDPLEAVLVTATSVVAQVAAVAPGGLGTYEAAAVVAYTSLGHQAGPALAAALTAHALKTAYSLGAGAVALSRPAPGLAGRLRLDPVPERIPAAPPGGHVALVLPAHDEEATVAEVVRRAPSRVLGRAVRVLVVDDGSTDATAREARATGADVFSLPSNHGLGAAVRAGLAEAVAGGAAAVAFCDADGEYASEEIERLLAPVLDGRADYVIGSRFAGDDRKMRWHRHLGNVVLTRLLSVVARRRLTDGQSGYRALSADAARAAEIVHDYNYAQVLTLDPLAKGFRYAEVPVSYSYRRHGRSFVKLGRYLRAVLPAVYRELNGEPALSVLDDVRPEAVASGPPRLVVEPAVGP